MGDKGKGKKVKQVRAQLVLFVEVTRAGRGIARFDVGVAELSWHEITLTIEMLKGKDHIPSVKLKAKDRGRHIAFDFESLSMGKVNPSVRGGGNTISSEVPPHPSCLSRLPSFNVQKP
ncbi:unnamed protein product [Sphenostylis stenocarpa]|uniref:Uncharacterized protein n=1 Tax=Sphenostylis stenocarpa TaxID=92480 RepID=A0AA86SPD9_9FABA|nr:unnamed protein product [Sphenostylis stenocarpa]